MNPDIQGARHQKQRYVRVMLKGDKTACTCTPADAADIIANEPSEFETEDIWLSPAEFEALPEFTGF